MPLNSSRPHEEAPGQADVQLHPEVVDADFSGELHHYVDYFEAIQYRNCARQGGNSFSILPSLLHYLLAHLVLLFLTETQRRRAK